MLVLGQKSVNKSNIISNNNKSELKQKQEHLRSTHSKNELENDSKALKSPQISNSINILENIMSVNIYDTLR